MERNLGRKGVDYEELRQRFQELELTLAGKVNLLSSTKG